MCAGACGGAAWLGCVVAFAAEPTPADRTLAQSLFEQGRALMAAKDYAAACPKLAESQRLDPSPGTILNLAVCHEQADKLATAWAEFNDAATIARLAGEGARARLAQDHARAIEPRLAHLTVKVPAQASALTVSLDGASLGSAAWGTPLPVDVGSHRIAASGDGKEVWSSVVVVRADGDALVVEIPSDVSSPSTAKPGAQSASPASTGAIPPPGDVGPPAEKQSPTALLIGAHLGAEIPTGRLPTQAGVDIGDVSGWGIAGGLDAGLRFERHWYVGATFEYAGFGQGHDLTTGIGAGVSKDTSQTIQLGAVLGFIVNPDKVSFLGEVGVSYRWYEYAWTDSASTPQNSQFNSAELLLGAGIWIPAGRSLRIVPEATVNFGTFAPPNSGNSSSSATASTQGHAFIMVGVGGFFDVGL